jgi:ubiquinone/menaquinone biosynthesis C-methylase UbiE
MNYAAWAEWYDIFYSTESSAEVDFYLGLMRGAGGPVLEVGVGTGRIAIPAAKEGIEVVGVDFSREMLAVAEGKAREAAPLPGGLTLIQADMRSLELSRKDFALVTIPARTLLLATTHEDQRRTLCCAARHLRPGGRLAFNIFNPTEDLIYDESTEPILIGKVKDPATGKTFRLTGINRFDNEAQLNRGTQIAEELDGRGRVKRRVELQVELRYLRPYEAMALLEEVGLDLEDVSGDFDGSPLTDESEEMVFMARQPYRSGS